ncbi:hypothetical protein ACMXYX_17675 (plasmid) [Neptuniibacter sp. QD72_48]|uniref:hypothetical protein n=1 Tax=Neptuniibacter sp. QD72_48 TaxID=3398214 RepID=UPI0039F64391
MAVSLEKRYKTYGPTRQCTLCAAEVVNLARIYDAIKESFAFEYKDEKSGEMKKEYSRDQDTCAELTEFEALAFFILKHGVPLLTGNEEVLTKNIRRRKIHEIEPYLEAAKMTHLLTKDVKRGNYRVQMYGLLQSNKAERDALLLHAERIAAEDKKTGKEIATFNYQHQAKNEIYQYLEAGTAKIKAGLEKDTERLEVFCQPTQKKLIEVGTEEYDKRVQQLIFKKLERYILRHHTDKLLEIVEHEFGKPKLLGA